MDLRIPEESVATLLAGYAQKCNDPPKHNDTVASKGVGKKTIGNCKIEAILKDIHSKECLYGVTITFSPKKRFNAQLISKIDSAVTLGNLPPNVQFVLTAAYLKELFKSFHFLLFEEYTKKGLIHWHGVVWHPSFKIPNSKIKTVLKGKLKRCGKANLNNQSLDIVNDIDAWVKYIMKEDGNFICSLVNDYGLEDDYNHLQGKMDLSILNQFIQQKSEPDVFVKYTKSILDFK